jgi:hypothetical protein
MQLDHFSRDDLQTLGQDQKGSCISIYLPIQRNTPQMNENRIRFKNLLREADKRLKEFGHPGEQSMLEEPQKLVDDKLFWQDQCDGLALFLSPGFFRFYCAPITFDEMVVVSNRFHIKPLLPFLTDDTRFYVLALSQNRVRLLQCTRHSFTEIELEGVPESREEALRYDEPEHQQQLHTGTAPRGGRGPAVFHSQGASVDNKDLILRFFQQVDRGLQKHLSRERAPLVLAGVDYLFPIYREANTYPHILEQGIPGNPDEVRSEELHQQAWEIVQPVLEKTVDNAAAQYDGLVGTGRSSNDVREVVQAAYYGRVDSLFVALGVHLWGSFDPNSDKVVIDREHKPGNEDLLDLSAVHTLLKGGTVYAVDADKVPDDGLMAAIYRY